MVTKKYEKSRLIESRPDDQTSTNCTEQGSSDSRHLQNQEQKENREHVGKV